MSRLPRALWPVAPLALLAATAGAQSVAPQPDEPELPRIERPGRPLLRDLERSGIYKNFGAGGGFGGKGGKTNEIYEAYLATHFSLLETIGRADSAVLRNRTTRGWHHGTAVVFTMGVNLRQTWDSSAPVRTPSYMPKLTWQHAWTRRDTTATGVAAINASSVSSHTLSLTIGHYSNGGDGCLYVGQVEVPTPDGKTACRVPPGTPEPSPDARTVNRRNGSFSSHYLQAGWTFRKSLPAGGEVEPAGPFVVAGRQWLVGVRLRDYSLLSGVPGGMDDELRPAYGPERLRLTGSYT